MNRAPQFADTDVLLQNPRCVIRRQEEGYLLYNPVTDELHLIPAAGYWAYRMCDGLHQVEEIAKSFSRIATGQNESANGAVKRFLQGLVDRYILEVATDD